MNVSVGTFREQSLGLGKANQVTQRMKTQEHTAAGTEAMESDRHPSFLSGELKSQKLMHFRATSGATHENQTCAPATGDRLTRLRLLRAKVPPRSPAVPPVFL